MADMRLLSLFSREPDGGRPLNTRSGNPRKKGIGYRAVIENKSYVVRNLSDSGIALVATHSPGKTVIIDLYKGKYHVKRCVAVQAWGRNGIHGFEFKKKLKLYDISDH